MKSINLFLQKYWYVLLAILLLTVVISIKEALTQNANGDPYIYWAVGKKFLTGQPLYEPVAGSQEFLYPPIAGLFCQLLALIPFPFAVGIFTFINFIAWLVLIGLTYKFLNYYFPHQSYKTALIVGLIATARYFWHNIVWVNVNELVALLSFGGLYMYLRNRLIIGLGFLSLAMWIKVMPLLLILMLFIRRPRQTFWAVLGYSALFTVILFAFRGVGQGIQDYQDYWQITFRPFLLEGKVFTDWIAFGISALLSKLLTAHPDINGIRYNIVSWPPAMVGQLSFLFRLLIVCLTYGSIWLNRKYRPLPLTNILLVVIAMLLVSGVAWEGHHLTLLLVVSGLYLLTTELTMYVLRRILVVSSLGVSLLISDLIGSHWSDYLQAFSLITYNVLLLFGIGLAVSHQFTKQLNVNRIRQSTIQQVAR